MKLPLCLIATAASARAVNLFVSSYSGTVSVLSLTQTATNYSLSVASGNGGCGESPSWLTLDKQNNVLYCLNEGFVTGTGSISSLLLGNGSSISPNQRVNTITGPVSSTIVGTGDDRQLVVAHYGGGAVTLWDITTSGELTNTRTFTFTLATPGPVPGRQGAPYEHQALADPTGQFVVVPDLGADLVRIFSFKDTVTELEPLEIAPGSGPRHATFWTTNTTEGNKTYLFLGTELTNMIYSYEVTYTDTLISFNKVFEISSYGPNPIPYGALAEVVMSPDNQFLYVSNRNDSSFTIPNSDPTNNIATASDSLAAFVPYPNGTLSFLQLAPSGGSYPRQFSINKAGDLIAVGNQLSGNIVILQRLATGEIGVAVASVEGLGEVTNVSWDE